MTALLQVTDLSLQFRTRGGTVNALQDVSLSIAKGETVGLVGESGSGKSVLSYALLGLSDAAARITRGSARFDGMDLLAAGEADLQEIRGPERRYHAYPFELSGGLCQRVMIALALACGPKLLIADEPTTGLDVTTQAAIMALIKEKTQARGMAMLLITHDLGLARAQCDRIVVMHAGHVVEAAPTEHLFTAPAHPYTRMLIGATPVGRASLAELSAIGGNLPDLRRTDLPACRFSERCPQRAAACAAPLPTVADGSHVVRCHLPQAAAVPVQELAA